MNTVTIKKEKIENFKNVRSEEMVNADIASIIKVDPELAIEKLEFQKGEIKMLEQQIEGLTVLRQNLIKERNNALVDISNKAGDIRSLQGKVSDYNEKYKTELSNNHYLKKSINNRNLIIAAIMVALLYFMFMTVYLTNVKFI